VSRRANDRQRNYKTCVRSAELNTQSVGPAASCSIESTKGVWFLSGAFFPSANGQSKAAAAIAAAAAAGVAAAAAAACSNRCSRRSSNSRTQQQQASHTYSKLKRTL